ncbi:dihydrofolate reductase family protein [Solirubrobacter sp. CPCC 204708]|uniref:Dihydrofolate reductase family protein n=1 Tax=Solirubrobacter deserti TaxID=2282478 RepID=A0ABT4RH62_9ACTN|nr:dihydrofolate reductase family protein [Solirubrobacter deserti]MBE2315178.1 dihydrofolate reductase family protein [Solirubrobacter deserti]MDA0137861.1 dihydrofolate reductase family protein [Solirubrobacter deserti]
MTKITAGASVSIDGYISGPDESGFEHLFAWYGNGDITIETADPDLPLNVTEPSAAHIRAMIDDTGCFVVGRHLFDITNGWGGKHTLGIPYVVLTHSVPDGWERSTEWYEFVTTGLEDAIAAARRRAGDKNVGLNGGTIVSQALEAGLVDEIDVDLVPVILGGGRPFFRPLEHGPYLLEGPISSVQGNRVTHLRYRVRK